MAHLTRFGFLAIAVVFHIIYTASIFDIYFVSPVVHGMAAFAVQRAPEAKAPAERLVLFVGDGLRADKAFQSFPDPSPADPSSPQAREPRPLAPFLRSRVESHGTFGVSHTRVPTESRPGHVALIAGLYEDVSSVTTGWKLNPVHFDSVFNRSRHTWSWGSPDILPMFKEGAVEGRVSSDTYGDEFEDFTMGKFPVGFGSSDQSAATNATVDAALRQDKVVFFLHLLGLDTTGHSYRPYSKEYLHNIKVVDQGVEKMTKMIDAFYGDDRTAYVFTADHGMSDWGSHGDGHPDNTRTPLVAWGAGVRKPVVDKTQTARGHEDGFSQDWGLDHVARHDVSQADVAALMAYLVGLEFPVNSVGRLPLAYLAGDEAEQAEAAFANVQGILEMYLVKEDQKRRHQIRYRPYAGFGEDNSTVSHRLAALRSTIEKKRYDLAISHSQELIELGLQGLRYLQTYDWLFLRAIITLGYLGWMAFAIITVLEWHVLHSNTKASRPLVLTATFGVVLLALYSRLFLQRSPLMYYLYVTFPVAFWEEVVARRAALTAGTRVLFGNLQSQREVMAVAVACVAALGLLEALVVSYFYREVYSVCFILASMWPFLYGQSFYRKHQSLITTWIVVCLAMSVFTFLPANKVENSTLILAGGFLMGLVGVLYLIFEDVLLARDSRDSRGPRAQTANGLSRAIVGVQIGLIVLAMAVTRSSVLALQARKGLPLGNQVTGWLLFVASLAVPFLHSLQPNEHYLHRLLVVFLAFSPTFIILTISYEGLFYLSFCALLITWVRLEHHVHTLTRSEIAPPSPPPTPKDLPSALSFTAGHRSTDESLQPTTFRALRLSDGRIALFTLFLLQAAFFSTGNIASVSSFSLDAVYRLLPVFDPFSQAALLAFKLLTPFVIISANLGILNRRLGMAPSALFMMVIAISDMLTLNFFWLVRDEGSWLEIGTSISHFFIVSALCIFIAGLELVSELFLSGVEVGDDGDAVSPRSNGVATTRPIKTNGRTQQHVATKAAKTA